jgi:hypothetical protein
MQFTRAYTFTDRETLTALLDAMKASLPMFRDISKPTKKLNRTNWWVSCPSSLERYYSFPEPTISENLAFFLSYLVCQASF